MTQQHFVYEKQSQLAPKVSVVKGQALSTGNVKIFLKTFNNFTFSI